MEMELVTRLLSHFSFYDFALQLGFFSFVSVEISRSLIYSVDNSEYMIPYVTLSRVH